MVSSSTCSSRREAQQADPQQRAAREVERPPRLLAGEPARLGLARRRRAGRPGRPAAAATAGGGAITCTGRPAGAAKVVRSASWRRTTRPSAAARAARRRGGRAGARRRACCRRRCRARAGRGTTAAPGRRTAGRPAPVPRRPRQRSERRLRRELRAARARAASTAAARAATVGASKSGRTGSSTPKTARSRAATRVASSEWPPRAKKSSSTARARPARRAAARCQIPASSSSTGLRGGAEPSPAGGARRARLEPASARRSTLPLGVSGSAVEPHDRPRAPCRPGRRSARNAPQLLRPRPGGTVARHDVGDQAAARPAASSRPRPRPRAPRDGAASAASISPGSMRKPRILTWWSTRPRNSRAPSGR